MEQWHIILSHFWIFGQYLGFIIKSKLPLFLVIIEFIYNCCILFVPTPPFDLLNPESSKAFLNQCLICLVKYTPSWCLIIVAILRLISVSVLFTCRRTRSLWIEIGVLAFCASSISIPAWNIYLYNTNSTSVVLFLIQIILIFFESLSLLFNRERARKRAAIWRDWNFSVSNRITLPTLSGSGSTLPTGTIGSRVYSNHPKMDMNLGEEVISYSNFYPLLEETENSLSYSSLWPQYSHQDNYMISQLITTSSGNFENNENLIKDSEKKSLPEVCHNDGTLHTFRYINIGDVLVNFKLEGTGKRLFCFIHQFGASLFTWRHIQNELSKYGVTFSYDRIAHGFSSRPPPDQPVHLPGFSQEFNPYSEKYSIHLSLFLINLFGKSSFQSEDDIQRHCVTWIPRTNNDESISTYLIGCAIGCSIAIECAILNNDISCLILISPSIYSEGFPGILRAIFRTEVGRSLTASIVKSELTDFMLKRAYYDHNKLNSSVVKGYDKPLQVAGWQEGFSSLFKYFKPMKVYEKFEKLKVPLLIIVGQNDKITPPREFQRLCSDLDSHKIKYKFEVIPNCGYLPHEEQPQIVMQKIKEFICSLET